MQDSDAVKGCFVIGVPINKEPNLKTIGYNVIDHVAMLWHWFPNDTADYTFRLGRSMRQRINGTAIIINGKGRGREFRRGGRSYFTPYEVFKVRQVFESLRTISTELPSICTKVKLFWI